MLQLTYSFKIWFKDRQVSETELYLKSLEVEPSAASNLFLSSLRARDRAQFLNFFCTIPTPKENFELPRDFQELQQNRVGVEILYFTLLSIYSLLNMKSLGTWKTSKIHLHFKETQRQFFLGVLSQGKQLNLWVDVEPVGSGIDRKKAEDTILRLPFFENSAKTVN